VHSYSFRVNYEDIAKSGIFCLLTTLTLSFFHSGHSGLTISQKRFADGNRVWIDANWPKTIPVALRHKTGKNILLLGVASY
jgi:hypothetical protein